MMNTHSGPEPGIVRALNLMVPINRYQAPHGRDMGSAVRILVVDDESDVRDLVCRMLRSAGYEVITGTGPADAKRIAAEIAFDLLITDVDMGEPRTGIALAQELMLVQPGMGVIFMSGSPHEQDIPVGHRLLAKPFLKADLLDAIGAVEAGSTAAGGGGRS